MNDPLLSILPKVNLASSCSHSLWREACAALAAQLSECDPVKSASCHLMVGEVIEAVTVLRKKQAFRMAVAIARSVSTLLEGLGGCVNLPSTEFTKPWKS